LPLAVLPGYVLNDLGLTSVFAGVVISSQYLARLGKSLIAILITVQVFLNGEHDKSSLLSAEHHI
jgi:hypothetical protein